MNIQYSIEYAEMMIIRTQMILSGVSAFQVWVFDLIVSISGIFQCSFESAQVIFLIALFTLIVICAIVSLVLMISAFKRFFRL